MTLRLQILGIPIDAVTLDEVIERLQAFVTSSEQHHVMTPNPEMLVEARKNPEFRAVLQKTSLNLPDGTGLLWAAKKQGVHLPERVTGVDVLEAFANRIEAKLFLLGAAPGVAEEAAKKLKNVVGTFSGSPEMTDDIVNRVNASGANALFVAYGAPKQDLWIAQNLFRMPNVKLAMGVGGAFDFLAGKRKRAPKWMQSAHLEWLYRLIKEPSRIGRIFNAVVVFPWLVLTDRGEASRM